MHIEVEDVGTRTVSVVLSLIIALLLVAAVGCDRGAREVSSGQLGGPISPGPVWTAETAWRLSEQPVVTIKGSERNMTNSPLDPVGVVRLRDGRYVVGDGNQRGTRSIRSIVRMSSTRATANSQDRFSVTNRVRHGPSRRAGVCPHSTASHSA